MNLDKSSLTFALGMFVCSLKCFEHSFLFIGLSIRNGTYASLAFISGVEHKNSSRNYGITAF